MKRGTLEKLCCKGQQEGVMDIILPRPVISQVGDLVLGRDNRWPEGQEEARPGLAPGGQCSALQVEASWSHGMSKAAL